MSDLAQIEEIAFHEIIRKLDTQRLDLQAIRNQASVSAAVTGLLATVFASILSGLERSSAFLGETFVGLSVEALVLLLSITASLGFSVLVVISWSNVTFSFNAEKMVEKAEVASTLREFYRSYIQDCELFFRDNEAKYERAQNHLWFAMVLGWAQIFPWVFLIME